MSVPGHSSDEINVAWLSPLSELDQTFRGPTAASERDPTTDIVAEGPNHN
jgi:hypothetical protein